MNRMRDIDGVAWHGIADSIEKWLIDETRRAGAKGIVVGLSGGVDSAVVAALGGRAFGKNMQALIMPCHSNPSDAEDALLVARRFGIPHRMIDLSETFDRMTALIETEEDNDVNGESGVKRDAARAGFSDMARANLKARLRMVTLYAVAQATSRLVCGTGNRSEWEVGYFTKHGDSASDLLPLLDLLKYEVRALARHLGVPEAIVEKAPSAGLWAGQTDEGEMGFGYDALDRYLETGAADPETRSKIEAMRKGSEHKRRPAAFFKKYW